MKTQSIHALRQRKINAANENQALIDAAKQAARELTTSEDQTFSKNMLAIKRFDLEIAEAEAQQADERNMAHVESLSAPLHGDPLAAPVRRGPGKVGAKYADLFGQPRSNDGFGSREEFLQAVHFAHQQYNPKLKSALFASSMNESVPSQGGFLVPEPLAAELLDAAIEDSIVLPRARVTPMSSETQKIAGFDASDNSTASPYGLKAVWANELAANTDQQGKLRLITLTANKLALFVNVSSELVADGLSFDSQISETIIKSISWTLDRAFLAVGDGSGKPLSVLNSPSLVTVTKETSQAAATIVPQNIFKMYSRLHPSCISDAVWVVNSTALPQLLGLTMIVTNVAGTENVGGGFVPIFESDGRGGYLMLGRPVIATEKLSALGTAGDIMLVCFREYSVGLRRELSLERSNLPGWSTDSVSYRSIIRVDGQPRWAKAFTPVTSGGSTLSWAVALGTR